MAKKSTFPCPLCGEDVPVKAKSCPACGACDKTGWNEQASQYDGLNLPDEEFDYDEFTKKEFGQTSGALGKRSLWKITGIVLFVLTVILIFCNSFFYP